MHETMDWRLQILGALATLLIAVVTASVPIVVRAFVRFLTLKLHIDVTEAQHAAMLQAATGAVMFAEEQASKELRANRVPLPSSMKMSLAKAYARNLLDKRGITGSGDVSEDELEVQIEAMLNAVRREESPKLEMLTVENVSVPPPPPLPRGTVQ